MNAHRGTQIVGQVLALAAAGSLSAAVALGGPALSPLVGGAVASATATIVPPSHPLTPPDPCRASC
jgi:autotransporter translocation and assembly factor TamB